MIFFLYLLPMCMLSKYIFAFYLTQTKLRNKFSMIVQISGSCQFFSNLEIVITLYITDCKLVNCM